MADSSAPNPQLLPSLGRLVRGLSALFWGLPTALIVCFYTARAPGLKDFGIVPPLAATALILYGLWQVGAFQKQERIWRNSLDRTRLLALVNFGLSPFLYWWQRVPDSTFFSLAVAILSFSALLFLGSLNFTLQRLGAMLPDETLRSEIAQFTRLNLNLLLATGLLTAVYFLLTRLDDAPLFLQALFLVLNQGSFFLLVLLVLLPLAMTMALLWKTKEVILDNIFGDQR